MGVGEARVVFGQVFGTRGDRTETRLRPQKIYDQLREKGLRDQDWQPRSKGRRVQHGVQVSTASPIRHYIRHYSSAFNSVFTHVIE